VLAILETSAARISGGLCNFEAQMELNDEVFRRGFMMVQEIRSYWLDQWSRGLGWDQWQAEGDSVRKSNSVAAEGRKSQAFSLDAFLDGGADRMAEQEHTDVTRLVQMCQIRSGRTLRVRDLISNRHFMRRAQRVISISQIFFPETLLHSAILDCGTSFSLLWSVIKPWMKRADEKFTILGAPFDIDQAVRKVGYQALEAVLSMNRRLRVYHWQQVVQNPPPDGKGQIVLATNRFELAPGEWCGRRVPQIDSSVVLFL